MFSRRYAEAVEPCWSFHVHRNRQEKRLELVSVYRKCLHLYQYYQHPQLGLMHVRLQTWFPFNLYVCINGRERLARQMDLASQRGGWLRKNRMSPK